jgi:tripartite-type tricarboxylate transporter receptor subunit TctC
LPIGGEDLMMGRCRARFGRIAALALALGCLSPAWAQDYPNRPIKIIVPTPPGGMADLLARTLGQKLTEASGQPVVVENRTGAAGVVAADAVAKSAPDGYTLMLGFHGVLSILPHLTKLPYDPVRDLIPVSHLALIPNVLVVHPDVPAKTVKELVDYARQNPGKLSYASQGNGSSGHMAGEQFKLMTGTDITHVPYRGAAPALQDLTAGHVHMMFDIVLFARAQISAGKVRALGVAARERAAALPDVPTIAESGMPGIEGGAWFGILAPGATPRPVVAWLNRECTKAFSDPAVRERFVSQGAALPLGSPEAFATFVAAETQRWGEVIRKAGIKME